MKNIIFLIVIISLLSCGTAEQEGYPQAEITNGLITAKLYLPDAQHGYYIGSRFEWSGIIYELKYEGHDYFGQWYPIRDPKIHDAISGPVEEFMQIGYEEAPVGGEFLRIGIGGMRKPEEERFDRYGYYEFSNPGKWTVKKEKDNVLFTHQLDDVAGYSYLYEKTVRLLKDKPELVLEHTLKNTGTRAIQTSVYNHNFFTIDHQTTDPDVVVKFAFLPRPSRESPLININGHKIEYVRALEQDETASLGQLLGHNNSVVDNDFVIENVRTRAGVRITGNRPISRIVYWSSTYTVCPEPYIDIDIQPGESFTWEINYRFYTIDNVTSDNI